jgi:hypothetical protein
VFRINSVTGTSLGANGCLNNFKPASSGNLLPFRLFTRRSASTQFSQELAPPREIGTTWSMFPSPGLNFFPVYWQIPPSRSQIAFAQNFGLRFGTRSNRASTSTVGTRTGPCTVPIA